MRSHNRFGRNTNKMKTLMRGALVGLATAAGVASFAACVPTSTTILNNREVVDAPQAHLSARAHSGTTAGLFAPYGGFCNNAYVYCPTQTQNAGFGQSAIPHPGGPVRVNFGENLAAKGELRLYNCGGIWWQTGVGACTYTGLLMVNR